VESEMQQRIRRFLESSDTPVTFAKTMIFTMLLLKFLGLIFNKVFFSFLDQDEFGIYVFITTTFSTLIVISSISLSSFIFRHCIEIDKTPDIKRNTEIFSTGLSMNTFLEFVTISILLLGYIFFEFDFLGQIEWNLLIIIGVVMIFIHINSIIQTYSLANYRSINYFILKTGPTVLKLIFGLILSVVFNLRVIGLLLAFFLGEVIIGLIGLKKIFKVGGFQKPQFKTVKKILDFSLPLYLAGFSLTLFNYSLPFLTSLIWGVEELTLYAAAFSVANLVGIFNPLFQSGYKTVNYNLYERNLHDKLISLTNQTIKVTLLIFLPVLAGVYFLSPELIALFSIESYSIAFKVIPFMLITFLVQSLLPLFCPGPGLVKKTRMNAILNVVSHVFGIFFAFTLIPLYGYIGIGMVLMIQNIIHLFLQIPLSQYYYRLPFDVKSFLVILLDFLLTISLCLFLIMILSFNRLLVVLIFIGIYGFMVIITKQFTKDEISFIKKMVKF
jgi:O-antigen/teichoic acid export membrane protein